MKLPKEGTHPQGDPDVRASRSRSRELKLSELRYVILIQTSIFILAVVLMTLR